MCVAKYLHLQNGKRVNGYLLILVNLERNAKAIEEVLSEDILGYIGLY